MKIEEISERYCIPLHVLQEYECLVSARGEVEDAVFDCNDHDLEALSLMVTLYEIGFSRAEVAVYTKLLLDGEDTTPQRLHMLKQRRRQILNDIHAYENQLDSLDYLRYELQNRNALEYGS